MIQNLDVELWGRKVGTLIAYKERYAQNACFYFDEDYVASGYDIAPLRASITAGIAKRRLPVYGDDEKIFGGLPSFIADSLPDHWGNQVFNEWAKKHKIRTDRLSALDRLAYIGRRGMGALEFVPPTAEELEKSFRVEISDLHRLARNAVELVRNFRSTLNPDLMIESLFKVGTSAGGRRPKAIINLNPETNECYSGQVAAPHPGFLPMIIKFDEHTAIPTTRIEYSYYLMGVQSGLSLMPSRLITGIKETHFLTERFDRVRDDKIHIQTLAAMNPLANSYEDLFETAHRLRLSATEKQRIFTAMVMNVLCGNVDDHNKNFSFTMGKDGIWHYAPTYDFTFTVDPESPSYVNRHSMSINGKVSDIHSSDLLTVAQSSDINNAEKIMGHCITEASDYSKFGREAGVEENWISMIQKEIDLRIRTLLK